MRPVHRVVFCLLVLFSARGLCAQPESPADSIIQMWRWESEDGYSSIDVCSPHLVLLEGTAYEFELYNGAFWFPAGRRTIPYRYDEIRSRLTLIFPEGPPLEYHPVLSSVYLRRITDQKIYNGRELFGRFCHPESYSRPDGPGTCEYGTRSIAFWSNGEFDFSSGAMYASIGTDESAALGTAVLCGDAVIMSFYTGQAAEAQVIERNSYSEVTRIKYGNDEYDVNECETFEEPLPPLPPPPPPDPPPFPPIPQPSPAPKPDPDPPEPPKIIERPGGNIRGPVHTTPTSSPPSTERPVSHRTGGDTQDSSSSSSSGSSSSSADRSSSSDRGGSGGSQSGGGRPGTKR